MKFILPGPYVFMLFAAMMVTGTACKKESSDTGSGYHIIQSDEYVNGTLWESLKYEYAGSRISKTVGSRLDTVTGQWKLYQVGEFIYPENNSINRTYSNMIDSTGELKEVIKFNEKFKDGKIIEDIFYGYLNSGAWIAYGKDNWTYVDQNLIQWMEYRNDSGYWKASAKTDFEYSGSLIKKSRFSIFVYGGWMTDFDNYFSYKGSQIENIMHYEPDSTHLNQNFKDVYEYTGNRVTGISTYGRSNGAWVLTQSVSFSYDPNGNLSYEVINRDSKEYKLIYTYESGTGNLNQLYPEANQLFYSGFTPHPTKGIHRHTDPIVTYVPSVVNNLSEQILLP